MSLYINHENQRILWESIQQHPSIDLIPQYDRNDWFKNIVKNVYETIPRPWFQRKITTEELNLLNQSTIRRMLGDLKPPVATLPPNSSGDLRSSSELVMQGLSSPFPNQNSQVTSVHLNQYPSNSSGSFATFRVSSEEAGSPLPKSNVFTSNPPW